MTVGAVHRDLTFYSHESPRALVPAFPDARTPSPLRHRTRGRHVQNLGKFPTGMVRSPTDFGKHSRALATTIYAESKPRFLCGTKLSPNSNKPENWFSPSCLKRLAWVRQECVCYRPHTAPLFLYASCGCDSPHDNLSFFLQSSSLPDIRADIDTLGVVRYLVHPITYTTCTSETGAKRILMPDSMHHHDGSKRKDLTFYKTLSTDTPEPGGLVRSISAFGSRNGWFDEIVFSSRVAHLLHRYDHGLRPSNLFVARYHSVEPNVSQHAAWSAARHIATAHLYRFSQDCSCLEA